MLNSTRCPDQRRVSETLEITYSTLRLHRRRRAPALNLKDLIVFQKVDKMSSIFEKLVSFWLKVREQGEGVEIALLEGFTRNAAEICHHESA